MVSFILIVLLFDLDLVVHITQTMQKISDLSDVSIFYLASVSRLNGSKNHGKQVRLHSSAYPPPKTPASQLAYPCCNLDAKSKPKKVVSVSLLQNIQHFPASERHTSNSEKGSPSFVTASFCMWCQCSKKRWNVVGTRSHCAMGKLVEKHTLNSSCYNGVRYWLLHPWKGKHFLKVRAKSTPLDIVWKVGITWRCTGWIPGTIQRSKLG